MTNIKWLGIIFLAVGFFLIWLTHKTWIKDRDIMAHNAKGLIVGFICIVIGITLIMGK